MVLSVTNLSGFAGGRSFGSAIDLTYLQTASNSTNATSHTYSAQNLGAEGSNRWIVIAISTYHTGVTAVNLTSCTIGGVTATLSDSSESQLSVGLSAHVLRALVPTGTTGDVVLTYASTISATAISLYTMRHDDPNFYISQSSNEVHPLSGNINIVPGGVCVAAGTAAAATDGMTWTGLTENADGSWATENANYTAASLSSASGGSFAVTLSNADSDTDGALAMASYYPVPDASEVPLANAVGGGTDPTSDLTSYTFTAEPIGTAAADRIVMVLATGADVISGTGFNTCTIAGNSATVISQQNTTSTIDLCMSVFYLLVPTGTTADIVVGVNSSTVDNCSIHVYEIHGSTLTPHASAFTSGNGVSSLAPSITLSARCAIIGVTVSRNSTVTWESLNQAFSSLTESKYTDSALGAMKDASFTETLTYGGSGDSMAGLIAWCGS